MSVEAAATKHWNAYAARWKLVGPPLRPSAADLAYLRDSVDRLLTPQRAPEQALLLGVTPEIAELIWPFSVELLAVDRSEGMVAAVWPGDTATRRARVGDWLNLDVTDGSFGLVVGDGVFSIFDYPSGYAQLASALARVLRPGGLLSVRLFCRPEPCESIDAVFDDLHARRIGNFHAFKWRLAMAVQGDATRGARLADIFDAFAARVPSIAELATRQGWPEPQVANIESYRDVADRYSFSSEREVLDVLATRFELLETWRPSYELGERCPHVSFRRRA